MRKRNERSGYAEERNDERRAGHRPSITARRVRAYEETDKAKHTIYNLEEYRSGCNGPHSKCGCHLSVAHGFESHLFRHAAAASIGRKEKNSHSVLVLFLCSFLLAALCLQRCECETCSVPQHSVLLHSPSPCSGRIPSLPPNGTQLNT